MVAVAARPDEDVVQMSISMGRAATRMLVIFAVLAVAVAGSPARVDAASADPVDVAKRKVETAKADAASARSRATQLSASANAVAGELTAVMTRLDRLNDQVAATQAKIAEARSREAALREQTLAQAIQQYKRSGAGLGFLDVTSQLTSVKKIVALTNERDTRIATGWRNAAQDLAVEESNLRRDQASVESQRASVVTKQRDIETRLTQARQAAQAAAVAEAAQLVAYDEAVKAAEAAKRADEALRLQQQRNALSARTTSGSGGSVTVGGVRCPIAGSVAFSNDWGQPRSGGRVHQGTDLFSSRGTPNVAVIGGTVTQVSEGLGGLTVYLAGDDGNTYYYAHLSGYAGGGGRVAVGATVGYTGSTGNASGGVTHTHFEIRRGGANGLKVNPYPTIAAAC